MVQTSPRASVASQFYNYPLPNPYAPWDSGRGSANPPARSFSGRLGRLGRGLSGLGQSTSPTGGCSASTNPVKTNSTASLATSAATWGAGSALSIASGVSSAAFAAGSIAAVAIPVVGAAIAGITIAISALLNSGCGQTCIVTSNWANQAETLLQQNITAYFAQPAPRSEASQTAALANFDSVWNYLSCQCDNPQLGTAGQRCITDRQSGACTWKQTSTSSLLSIPGEPQAGACWNWFSGYRDPIANDPDVTSSDESDAAISAMGSDPVGAIANTVGASTPSTSTLVLGAGILLLLMGAFNG